MAVISQMRQNQTRPLYAIYPETAVRYRCLWKVGANFQAKWPASIMIAIRTVTVTVTANKGAMK